MAYLKVAPVEMRSGGVKKNEHSSFIKSYEYFV
jgi:hypothetical protein